MWVVQSAVLDTETFQLQRQAHERVTSRGGSPRPLRLPSCGPGRRGAGRRLPLCPFQIPAHRIPRPTK